MNSANSKCIFLFLCIGVFLGIFLAGTYLLFVPFDRVVSSPEHGRDIVSFIDSSTRSLSVEMYLLTDDRAIQSIISAHERGVDVHVILENNVMDYQNNEAYRALVSHGVPTLLVSTNGALTHTKLIIVDGVRAYVGSHNLSRNALSKNREIGIITTYPPSVNELVRLFESDWNRHSPSIRSST